MPAGVFVDSSVLYSRTLRDWLFLIKLRSRGGIFTIHCSRDVIAETIARVRDKNPLMPGGQITAIFNKIEENIDDCVSEYEIERAWGGSDEGDAHVHAAAAASGAEYLLTSDRGFLDLAENVKDGLPYEIYAPDTFFAFIETQHPALINEVTREQVQYWCRRPDGQNLTEALRAAECPEFAARVLAHLQCF